VGADAVTVNGSLVNKVGDVAGGPGSQ